MADAGPASGGVTAEGSGETVGEAKWAALRELERRHPGLDRGAVRFQVVSEGERGLLGVGFTPARVLASAPAEAVAPARRAPSDESALAAHARELVERIVGELGVSCRVEVEEHPETLEIGCHGPELGLLIGKHGQTIDAIQYLVNAILARAHGEGRKDAVVDAAGYRARRVATLESLAVRTAERVAASGEPVELEPMSAVERKVVHLKLKELGGVETTSEGTEPNRHVVISPAAHAAPPSSGPEGPPMHGEASGSGEGQLGA
jgi:spoIIIJ-associated protein